MNGGDIQSPVYFGAVFFEEKQMKSKELSVLVVILLAGLFFMVFSSLTGRAGSLEPAAGPQPTMVTLGELSSQIQSVSYPVEKVVRGVVTFPYGSSAEQSQVFLPSVDPNRCVVLLSDAVATSHPTTDDSWVSRTGACLGGLSSSEITILVEEQPCEQKVSYQIIEYR